MIKKKIEELKGPREPREPKESFNPVELEQTFNRAYRSYTINGRSIMDVHTFFDWIRQNLIGLITRELTDLGLARVQTTAWIRFIQPLLDDFEVDRVEMACNSRITEIFQGSYLNEIVNEMLAHMKMQIENPALKRSGFRFDEVLFLYVNFYQLNLTRGSSYLPLPDGIAKKKAIINPKNENDEECFKWAVIAALHHKEIKYNPERTSTLTKFEDNYDLGWIRVPLTN